MQAVTVAWPCMQIVVRKRCEPCPSLSELRLPIGNRSDWFSEPPLTMTTALADCYTKHGWRLPITMNKVTQFPTRSRHENLQRELRLL